MLKFVFGDDDKVEIENFQDDADTDAEDVPAKERAEYSDTEDSRADKEPNHEDFIYLGKGQIT